MGQRSHFHLLSLTAKKNYTFCQGELSFEIVIYVHNDIAMLFSLRYCEIDDTGTSLLIMIVPTPFTTTTVYAYVI